MRVSEKFSPSLAWIRVMIGLVFISIFWGIAWAVQRQSAGYAISIDALTSAGGASASTSYRQTDSALGQESVCGLTTGLNIRNDSGVIQPWGTPRSGADAWKFYR